MSVAVSQYNEDKLFEIWLKSMSEKSYPEWKKEVENKAKHNTGDGSITGADLAHMKSS